jgi:N-acetylneuraminic acid mutarotase
LVYGTKGVPSVNNQPSARVQASAQRDSTGKFWLFGGSGFGLAGSKGSLSDLWQYDPAAGTWTWISGPSVANTAPTYGSRGIAAAGNVPGARMAHVSWMDSAGNFWIFGGIGLDSANTQKSLNDLWKYSPASGNWTWLSGSSFGNAGPVHGTRGTPASTNVPGARYLPVSWVDASANLWLFGGYGFGAATNNLAVEQNDLWRFAP